MQRKMHTGNEFYRGNTAEYGFRGRSASDSGHAAFKKSRKGSRKMKPSRQRYRADARPYTREDSMWYEKSLRYPPATIPRPVSKRQSFARNKKYRPSGLCDITPRMDESERPHTRHASRRCPYRSARFPRMSRHRISPMPTGCEDGDKSTTSSARASFRNDDRVLIQVDSSQNEQEKSREKASSNKSAPSMPTSKILKICCIVNLLLSAVLFGITIYMTVTNSQSIKGNEGQLEKINSYLVVSEDNIMKHYSKVIGEMQFKIEALGAETEEAKMRIRRHDKSIARNEENIEELFRESEKVDEDAWQNLHSMERDFGLMRNDLLDLKGDHQSVETKISDMTAKIKELENTNNEMELLDDKVTELQGSMSKNDATDEFHNSLQALKGKVDEIESETSSRLDNLLGEMTGVTADITDISHVRNALQNEIESLQRTVSDSGDLLEKLQSRVSDILRDNKNMKIKIDSIEQDSVTNAPKGMGQIENIRGDIASLREGTKSLEAAVSESANERKMLQSKLRDFLENQPDTAERETGQISKNTNEIQALQNDFDTSRQQPEKNKLEIEKLQNVARSLSSEITKSHQNHDTLADEVNGIKEELEGIGTEIDDIKSVLNSVQDDRKKEMQALAEKQEEMAKWRDLEKRYENFGESLLF